MNKGSNPTAGSISKPGDANAIRTDIGPSGLPPSGYRPQDGAVYGNIGTSLRVVGSQPGMDPRDPKNPAKSGTGGIDTTAREGV